MTTWKQVGVISVDAGLCWIGDPCYCVTPDASSHPAKTWGEFCNLLRDKGPGPLYPQSGNEVVTKEQIHEYKEAIAAQQWEFSGGNTGLGVTVTTGFGDGIYPVYVLLDDEGDVKEAKVVFIETSNNTDSD
jgi:hypothetical protein